MCIRDSPCFGRVLALDGVVQTTEADEFIYHEMMAHVPLLAHGQATEVLIIGGGDGGMLREVVRHPNVKRVVQVEIDQAVIEMSERFLPQHSRGAFQDPRVEIVIADGLQFVQETALRFDVIISDSTDPVGPGEALFTKGFYMPTVIAASSREESWPPRTASATCSSGRCVTPTSVCDPSLPMPPSMAHRYRPMSGVS